MLIPRQMSSFREGETTCQRFSNRGSTGTAVDAVNHHLRCLILEKIGIILEKLGAHISILWAMCIYTARMRLEFDNQKTKV